MIKLLIYMMSFIVCIYGVMAIPFHKFCDKSKPVATMILIMVISMTLAYFVASFLCEISIYNGL